MDEIGIGAVGCGGFGMFALEQMTGVPGLRIRAVSDLSPETAENAARRFGAAVVESTSDLVSREGVDLVYTGTPPFLHHEIGMQALRAGRHVLCEKPLAVTLDQGREMVDLARSHDLLCVANLMQPYNPLFDRVLRLVESGLLGDVLHGFFENYASDEKLGPEHWFWNRERSGGIFIEHAVHFFDLFERLLGEGRVLCASRTLRPDPEGGEPRIEEQVECTILHAGRPGARLSADASATRAPVTVHSYHGFHQAGHMDRQELRLVFERGDLTLYEWVPVRGRLDALVDDAREEALRSLFDDASVQVLERWEGDAQVGGRHKRFAADRRIVLEFGQGIPKYDRYAEIVRAMVEDQVAWIRDRRHERRVTERTSLRALEVAVEATRRATTGHSAG